MEEIGRYRIELNRDWALDDLYIFPRAYEQVYFFYASISSDLSLTDSERMDRAYKAFPWQGGYSAVSFFNELKYATRRQVRPKIIAIQKHSPGYFDLALWIATATTVAGVITKIASTIDSANTTYNNIYKGMQERKLLKLKADETELKFRKAEMDYILKSSQQMSTLLGFRSLAQMHETTGNPYLTLKILLSVYRRVRTLAEYVNKGKAGFTYGEIDALDVPIEPKTNTKARSKRKKGR